MDKLIENLEDAVRAFSATADGPVRDSEHAIDAMAEASRMLVAAWKEHGPTFLGGLGVLYQLAEKKLDGEVGDDGDEYVLENDQAVDTVTSLVEQARELLGVPQPPRCDDARKEA